MLYDFGPRLLKLRKDKNLTQQMVVERAKGFDPNLRLSDSVLGKYESDLAVPRLTEAAALADVLNVSLDYLTSGEKCNVLSLKPRAGAIAYGLDSVHSNQEKKISRTQKCSETNNRGNGIDNSAHC